VSITVYGTISEIEATTPPPPEPPSGEEPTHPIVPLSEEPIAAQALRDAVPAYRAGLAPTLLEGEEPPQTWVHVHIVLNPPHAGELTIECPQTQVGGMLVVGGRARVMLASN
jgi:hypothetical protein